VKAFVVLTSEYAPRAQRSEDRKVLTKELQDFCKQNAAPYKYPRRIQFVDIAFLPKTISGKIRRAELKALEWDREKGKVGVLSKL
jgi:acyl-coenzyme A synthetase/AMP-(fatty) acid ligase